MRLPLALLAFLACPVQAQTAREVPNSLFGFELGGVYEFSAGGAANTVGSFPVKRLVSEQLTLHRGVDVFFEPLTDDDTLPFGETAPVNGGRPMTSHSVRVYPVLPEKLTTLAELREQNLPQRVTMIEWSSRGVRLGDRQRYEWAVDRCKSIETELQLTPRVIDRPESGTYTCAFASLGRELEVSSVVGQTVQLSIDDGVADRIEAEIYGKIRRLELLELQELRRARAAEARQ